MANAEHQTDGHSGGWSEPVRDRQGATRDYRAGPPVLEVVNVQHSYDEVIALSGVSLSVWLGEFVTILGPSGSGKTTLLRVIAGLENPSAIDTLRVDGVDVHGVPANHRNVATVFQHYALFPHMSVGENVEYGLRVRKVPPAERRKRAVEALDYVRLSGLYDRRVHQLSGAEQQRAALARALVTDPAILLLDEPLGSLDEKLRVEMQIELSELQRRLGRTFVHVTHSQEEALTMSDRVILMRDGRIEQIGPPRDLFERPATRFVAEFMGVENIFNGVVTECTGGVAVVRIGDSVFRGSHRAGEPPAVGASVFVAVRAEKVWADDGVDDLPDDVNRVTCAAVSMVYKGKYVDIGLETGIGRLTARIWDRVDEARSPSHAYWRTGDCVVAPNE